MLATLRRGASSGEVRSDIHLATLADRICQSMLHVGLDVIRHDAAAAPEQLGHPRHRRADHRHAGRQGLERHHRQSLRVRADHQHVGAGDQLGVTAAVGVHRDSDRARDHHLASFGGVGIRQALDQPVDFTVEPQSLKDAIDFIAARYQIPIVVDQKSLDDANVDRFCALLDDMRKRTDTRFVVVTHNPITMARMDRLYGVTMAEQGVSQVVSVDLATAERFREAS